MSAALESSTELPRLLKAAHPPFSAAQERSGWHALKRRALSREQRLRSFYWLSFSLALAGAALALGIFIGRSSDGQPLSYVVGAGRVSEEGKLRATSGPGSTLRFSDGSTVQLGSKTRGRLVHLTAGGARLRLADGEADVSLAARAGSNWELDAGPYAIFARATSLFVRWSEAEQLLEVRVQGGTVEVDGPLANDGIVLRGGQQLTIRRTQGEIVVRDASR